MRCLALLLLTSAVSTISASLPGSRSRADGSAATVRGVPASKASLYGPGRDFECLDGSERLAFEKVNDDYCDCEDGSDEPGTAACPNGHFHCQNTGYTGYFIPTSWVNDGVCDCCDGSDEYDSDVSCQDNCEDLARQEWEASMQSARLYKEGGKIRDELIEKGKRVRVENQEKLARLRTELEEAERIKKEREVVKKQAEERESAALEKYKPTTPQPEETAEGEADRDIEEEQEIEEYEAGDYFKTLDSDGSGTVTIAEIQTRGIFDKDRNGEVSREEALYFLNNKEEITGEEFVQFAWANIKPFLMLNKGLFKPAEKQEIEEELSEESAEPLSEEEEEEAPERENDVESEGEVKEVGEEQAELERPEEESQPAEESAPQYDEETQAIIDVAKEARDKYQEAERTVLALLSEIRQYEERVERDYGSKDEYAPLDGQCYEHQTQEYVYSLCLFGRATQRSISGGSEVSLGQWNSWTGGEGEHKYTAAKYDRGLTCWNGPARSTNVVFKCGVEPSLASVSEPNRCEYAMELITPAACNIDLVDRKFVQDPHDVLHEHEEL